MWRDGGVIDEVAVALVAASALYPGQRRPLPCGRIDHLAVQSQEEAIAVVCHLAGELGVAWPVVEVVEPAGDVSCRGAAGEELRGRYVVYVVDDGVEREREQVHAQQTVVVDGSAPGLADAAGGGEDARR